MHLIFIFSLAATVYSWQHEDPDKLLGAWTDGEVRLEIYEEKGEKRFSHRMVLDVDGTTTRKWGRWVDNTFVGAAIGALPNSMSGESELVSVDKPRGRMVCHQLFVYGVPQDTELNYEMDFRR